MGSSPWPQGTRSRSLKRIWPWLALLGLLGMVRWSKGAGFADAYALLTRPFWPGSAQKQWIQSAQQQNDAVRLQLEVDNARLRGLLSLDGQGANNAISAAVISRTPEGWWQQIVLGKGGLDGIQQGDAEIGPGGLIGRVQKIGRASCRERV